MLADENKRLRRHELTTWEFQAVLAEEFIAYVDVEKELIVSKSAEASAMTLIQSGHRPIEISRNVRRYCCVCRIEDNIVRRCELKNKTDWTYDLGPSSRAQMNMCQCSFPNCTLVCHVVKSSRNKRMIFNLPQFEGLNCFEIGHRLQEDGMFTCKADAGSRQNMGVHTSHPVWQKLRESYGMPNKKRQRGKTTGTMPVDDSGSSSSSSSSGDEGSALKSNEDDDSDNEKEMVDEQV